MPCLSLPSEAGNYMMDRILVRIDWENAMDGPVYALNLFNVTNRDEYLAYSRRSPKEVQSHGEDLRPLLKQP